MKYYAGILAGGIGSRMASAKMPKQFLKVAGVPVMIRTLRAFLEEERIEHIYIAMNEGFIEYSKELLAEYNMSESKITIIKGGADRFGSLYALATAVAENGADSILISHDCARPFVDQRIISENIEEANHFDMVTTSVPTIDTIIISEDGRRSNNVPQRDKIYCDQGPQTFNAKFFVEMADGLTDEERRKYMEAGKLYLHKGLSVGIVKGSIENFKITNDIDLDIAEAVCKRREKRA